MGGSGSTGRKVSFGLDDEDRVRVLRGVRLSDDVVSRMKDPYVFPAEQKTSSTLRSSPSLPASPTSNDSEGKAKTEGSHQKTTQGERKQPPETDEDLYRRYEREQAIIQEELARLAKREREAAHGKLSSSILLEKNYTNQERRRAEILPADLDEWAKELEHKEEELRRLDIFHKEQLASIEKKNLEIYKMTAEQFHTAATNAEFRVKKRSYDPVCLDLQNNILKCYKDNYQELLNCSDLAKEYQRCVSAAQENLLFNHE